MVEIFFDMEVLMRRKVLLAGLGKALWNKRGFQTGFWILFVVNCWR